MAMNRPANKQYCTTVVNFPFKYSHCKEAAEFIKLYFIAVANGEGLYELDHSFMFSL